MKSIQILVLIVFLSVTRQVKEYDKKPLSEVNVFVNAPMIDVLDMKETLRRRRQQKEMIRNMEQKIQVDKNAFQQVTTIQNGQIQKLAELVKMNNFYASRKGQYNYQTNYDKDISKQRDEDFKVQTQVETLTDPYEYQPDKPDNIKGLTQALSYDKNAYDTQNYNQVVDEIYN